MPFDNKLRYTYEDTHIKFITPILKKAFPDQQIFDNAYNNILSPFCFMLESELKKKEPCKQVIIDCLSEIIDQKSEFIISDNYLLLEPIETRGESLELVNSVDEERFFFLETLVSLKVKLMPEWVELISIIKSISFVNIKGKKDTKIATYIGKFNSYITTIAKPGFLLSKNFSFNPVKNSFNGAAEWIIFDKRNRGRNDFTINKAQNF